MPMFLLQNAGSSGVLFNIFLLFVLIIGMLLGTLIAFLEPMKKEVVGFLPLVLVLIFQILTLTTSDPPMLLLTNPPVDRARFSLRFAVPILDMDNFTPS